MFSKNNHLLTDRQCTHQNPKFALRKLSIGVASVLLGTIFLMGEANVQADTVTDANQENPVIATTTADTQNKSTSKRNIDQAKQLINNQTTVVFRCLLLSPKQTTYGWLPCFDTGGCQ